MSTVIQDIESSQLREGIPTFAPGDRVRVHFLVIEGNRKRPQVFEGVVIKRQGSGVRETFTVRKQSFGVGVERTFPLHSPKIEKLEVASRGRVRRAKLYYLRGRVGKAARVAERRWGIDDDMVGGSEAVDASGEAQESIEEVTESAESESPEAEATDAAESTAAEGTEAPKVATEPPADGPAEEQIEAPAEEQAEAPAEEQIEAPAEEQAEAPAGEAEEAPEGKLPETDDEGDASAQPAEDGERDNKDEV